MLDERVIALARKTSAVEWKDRDQPLALRVAAWKRQLHGNGRLFIYVMKTYEEEAGARARILWKNLQRAFSSIAAPQNPELRNDLLAELRAQLDEVGRDLAPRFDKDMKDKPATVDHAARLRDALAHELERHTAEIEHFVASIEVAAARGAPIGGTYNFYGAVGAVMTGAGAIGNVVQSFGSDQKQALIAALDEARNAITNAPELTGKDREEVEEIVADAIAEVGRDQPNSRKLSQALQNVAATVQGVANGSQAYEAIRAAASVIGLTL